MPLIVTILPGVEGAMADAFRRQLEPVRQKIGDDLLFVNVGVEEVTVFLPREKELISSDWTELEPEVRDDGRRFYRYRRDHNRPVVSGGDVPADVGAAVLAMLRLP